MKHFRRFLSMCMAVVILCGAAVGVSADHTVPSDIYPGTTAFHGTLETGCYGIQDFYLPYPITGNYFKSSNLGETVTYYSDKFLRYTEWYDYMKEYYVGVKYVGGVCYQDSTKLYQALAYLWANSYNANSTEIWPVEYLDILEADISNYKLMVSPLATDDDPDLAQFRTGNCTIIDDETLLVDCSADYSITYSTEYENTIYGEKYFHILLDNDFEVNVYAAITDKATGDLVYFTLGYNSDGYKLRLTPEYKHGQERTICYTYFEEVNYTLEDFLGYKPSEIQGNYCGTSTATAKFHLPDFYDSSKHDVTICFRKPGYVDEKPSIGQGMYSGSYYLENYSSGEYYTPYRLSDIEYDSETDSEPIPGDVDGDGEMSAADVATLSRYLSGGEVAIADSADITADGKIVVNDLATIRRLLSGGEL